LKAKKSVEVLKTKNGLELMEELNLIPKKQKDTIKELLEKKRDMAMKGTFKLPKFRNQQNRGRKTQIFDNNISTVEEEDEEHKSGEHLELDKDFFQRIVEQDVPTNRTTIRTPSSKTNQ